MCVCGCLRWMALIMAVIIFPCAAHASGEIVISGSTTVLPILQKAAEEFMRYNPGVIISLSGGGSGNGLNALSNGLCHVAMSSRPMKENELREAHAHNILPVAHQIAHDALIPVVHPANPVQALSLAQLRDIYAGRITRWSEVGGSDERIIVISRDTSSGTFEGWSERVMLKERVTPSALLQASNGIIMMIVSGNKKAMGYIGFGYLNAGVRPVCVEGVVPGSEAVTQGKWPISRELFVFTNGNPSGSLGRFIDFLLDKNKGQKIVKETGFVPL